ncbi:MAG: DHH family phosphoesterase [Anaerolineae bacterium]|nr:DHH family phosphoesterase [Anaerolineae bacterium]
MAFDRLGDLLGAVRHSRQLLIIPHNDPDPDAIASAVALRYLLGERAGVESRITYRGVVGRAENKALLDYLEWPLTHLHFAQPCPPLPTALIDTQPGAGNNALPAQCELVVVIDHHPLREETVHAAFRDVRPGIGATSTLLTGYIRAAGIDPPPWLATALFYGIKTDTMGLSRGICELDVDAYFYLQHKIDMEALVQIERARVPPQYFQSLVAALQAAQVYDRVVVSYLGAMHYPGLAAEMADLLLRLDGIEWVICLGTFRDELILSVRNTHDKDAERVVQGIVRGRGTAGGHGAMAGGQVPLQEGDPDALARDLAQQALACLGLPPDTQGQPLV